MTESLLLSRSTPFFLETTSHATTPFRLASSPTLLPQSIRFLDASFSLERLSGLYNHLEEGGVCP
uniref:Uncharacterized protein n=1 Tax=Salix viminalis TaxID=40686 RepID=A0A6N2L3T1_SALVM